MERRQFLNSFAGSVLTAGAALPLRAQEEGEPRVMTVLGEIPATQMGRTLPHEHVLVDFIGADKASPERYDADDAFKRVLPYLVKAKDAGCQTFIDCAPAHLGRDPALLKRFAEASGLHMMTNTGYYGSRQPKYLPKHALEETSDQLAARWIKEFEQGIDDTGIRPGFIKI